MAKSDARKGAKAESTGDNTPTAGSLYEGVVKRVDDTRKILTVKLDSGDAMVSCIYAGGIFSALLGLQTRFLPPRGTRVVVLKGRESYIIGCLPSAGSDPISGGKRTMTGCGLDPKESGIRKPTPGKNTEMDAADVQTHPFDLLEGELDLSNALGVGVRLLTHMSVLNAGDRAKVETCLLNDMVRIVSDTFKHHSAFGDQQIYNDGRLNVRFDGTSYPHEAAGAVNETDPKVEMKGLEADLKQIVGETGRWRYSEYLGFLGDFITTIVADPAAVVGNFAENAIRSGKARLHVNTDGTILAQSVAEIALERVVRIPVPIEKMRPDDPRGNVQDDFKELDKKYLKLWEYGKNPLDMAKTCFQLREYARWLSNYHAYARFHQLDKDWKVPLEADTPPPSPGNLEEDRAASAGEKFVEAYSTIRLMRDGSIVSMDAAGSSVVMTQGDVYVCAARNMHIQSAGDLTISAGQDLHLKAGRHVSVTATLGGFLSKARQGWKVLCEQGPVWLKSDMDPEEKHEEADDLGPYGILLDAEKSGAMLRSSKKTSVVSDGREDGDGIEIVASLKDVSIIARRRLGISSLSGTVVIKAIKAICLDTHRFVSKAVANSLGSRFTVRGGHVACSGLHAEIVAGYSAVVAPERGSGGESDHYNHVGVVSGESPGFDDVDDIEEAEDYDPEIKEDEAVSARKWDFQDEKDYQLSSVELFETTAQQKIRHEAIEGYEEIPAEEEPLKPGPHTGKGSPYPGKNAKLWSHSGGENLGEPSSKAYESYGNKATAFQRVKRALQALRSE